MVTRGICAPAGKGEIAIGTVATTGVGNQGAILAVGEIMDQRHGAINWDAPGESGHGDLGQWQRTLFIFMGKLQRRTFRDLLLEQDLYTLDHRFGVETFDHPFAL